MRSVFWRIFLWFWLAMLLMLAAVAGTIYLTDPEQFFPRQLDIPLQRLDQLAATSVAIYEKSGSAGLRAYLLKLPPAPPFAGHSVRSRTERGFLVDLETGRELSGLPLPTDTHELVSRARDSADLQLTRLLTEVVLARPVTGAPSGHRYVFYSAGHVRFSCCPPHLMDGCRLLPPSSPQHWYVTGWRVPWWDRCVDCKRRRGGWQAATSGHGWAPAPLW